MESIEELAERLSKGLDLDQPSCDIFELRAETWWSGEVDLVWDLWSEDPAGRDAELAWLQARLALLCSHFAEKEEFERCSVLQNLEKKLF